MLKPNREQKKKLRQWMGAYRFVFNATVSYKDFLYQRDGKSKSCRGKGENSFRKELTEKLHQENPWLALGQIPPHTLYGAMQDAHLAYEACVGKRKLGLKCALPRCRKYKQRSFFILGRSVKPHSIYPSKKYLGKELRAAEPLPNQPSDGRIIHEGGRWYLRYSYKKQVQRSVAEKDENQVRLCSLDIGIRTFATVFAHDGVAKIGQGNFSRIVRLCLALDSLISKMSKTRGKTRKNRLGVAVARARLRIKNLISDLHWQAAGWLTRHYDVIVVPDGDFSSAVIKAERNIRSKTARMLMSFGFAKFRERLKHAALLKGKRVVVVDEAYTSKTANWTGEIKRKLGGAKTIISNGIRLCRDVNGALGIMLKALLGQPARERAATTV